MRPLSRRRRLLFAVVMVGLTWAVCELLVAFALSRGQEPVAALDAEQLVGRHRAAIERLLSGRTELIVLSPRLGWTVKPGGSAGPLRVNHQGVRADREYQSMPAPGVLRLVTFGDSFTLGSEVELEDTWQVRLEQTVPDLEALNFGVGGFGPDQAYLRYLDEGRTWGAQVVILGFMSENISRLVNVFPPFYLPRTGLPLAKPRFQIVDGRLELLPSPLPDAAAYRELLADPEGVLARLGEHDTFHRQYRATSVPLLSQLPSLKAVRYWSTRLRRGGNAGVADGGFGYLTDSEAYQVLVGILEAFNEQVIQDGARPLVLLLPRREHLAAAVDGVPLCYVPLMRDLSARDVPHLDVAPALVAWVEGGGDFEQLFAPHAHYAPTGNRLVAETLANYLVQQNLVPDLGCQREEPSGHSR